MSGATWTPETGSPDRGNACDPGCRNCACMTDVTYTKPGDGQGSIGGGSGGEAPEPGEIVETDEGPKRVTKTRHYTSNKWDDVVQCDVEDP